MTLDNRGNSVLPIALRLDANSGVPPYLQLVQQVEQALRLGILAPGDRLPTVKQVVSTLAMNPNTVLKAYRELEHRGLASGRPGVGTFIERTLPTAPPRVQLTLQRSLAKWIATAIEQGLDEPGIVALFNSVLEEATHEQRGVA